MNEYIIKKLIKGNTNINMKTINIINTYSTITIQYYYKKSGT